MLALPLIFTRPPPLLTANYTRRRGDRAGAMTSYKLVTPEWLEAHLDDPGVRILEFNWNDTSSYDEWHIPGALGWFWKDWLWDDDIRDFPTPEEFARRCAAVGISNDTIVVCYGDPVQFGTYGWWVMRYMGHKDVRLLDGARVRWQAEGRPMTTEVPSFAPAGYTPNGPRNDAMRARRDDILALLDDVQAGGTVLLDHRSPEEYSGERVNMPGVPNAGAERAGRIPGARHLYYTELFNEDMSYKSPDELRALLAERGATPDKDIVSYCRLSHRATSAYFAMTELLGYGHVRSYDGSWTEWGSIVGVPIER